MIARIFLVLKREIFLTFIFRDECLICELSLKPIVTDDPGGVSESHRTSPLLSSLFMSCKATPAPLSSPRSRLSPVSALLTICDLVSSARCEVCMAPKPVPGLVCHSSPGRLRTGPTLSPSR